MLVDKLKLSDGDAVLDVGCGKGFLLYEMKQVLPNLRITGLEISEYAVDHAKPEVKPCITKGCASKLPFVDAEFDAVVSLGTLHNFCPSN